MHLKNFKHAWNAQKCTISSEKSPKFFPSLAGEGTLPQIRSPRGLGHSMLVCTATSFFLQFMAWHHVPETLGSLLFHHIFSLTENKSVKSTWRIIRCEYVVMFVIQ